uniref:NADH-ubiquinone oxidoreductase chain 4 n=2 Tax=Bactericera cockerelli TaxID=290155 RepID=A0A166GKV6_9HEMI|nr:NADH dehydrogenase subunit 4 [Bactericera cockerelli]ANA07532.1 NADH dehydrogenase subunit 4 [Bactericera cockerelli]
MLEVMLSILTIVVLKNWLLMMNSLVLWVLFLLFKIYDDGEYILSIILVLLSLWLTVMMLMSVNTQIKSVDLICVFTAVLFSLGVVFYCESMFFFYVGFEMSVIPILLIIFGWGYQPDRMEAGLYMILYTVFFSLPLLVGVFYMEYFSLLDSTLTYLMYMMAFFVKFPMVGLHLWLPRAHVEAPVFGSMILAGVMLKLGGYGIIKISFIMGDMIFLYSFYIIVGSIVGGLILSGVCFVQSDMKMLVAYSSVVHMSIVLAGLLTLRDSGLYGAIYMMVGHGFCSSGLFCILGLTYNRTLTRSLYLNKGIMSILPSCSLWWFLFCSGNLSFPPSLNLPGEILLFISILSWQNSLYLLMAFFGTVSSMYSIYLFSFTQQGLSTNFFCFKCFSLKESLVMFLHWVPLNLFIVDLSLMSF